MTHLVTGVDDDLGGGGALVDGVRAVRQDLGFHYGYQPVLLADGGVASQTIGVLMDCLPSAARPSLRRTCSDPPALTHCRTSAAEERGAQTGTQVSLPQVQEPRAKARTQVSPRHRMEELK